MQGIDTRPAAPLISLAPGRHSFAERALPATKNFSGRSNEAEERRGSLDGAFSKSSAGHDGCDRQSRVAAGFPIGGSCARCGDFDHGLFADSTPSLLVRQGGSQGRVVEVVGDLDLHEVVDVAVPSGDAGVGQTWEIEPDTSGWLDVNDTIHALADTDAHRCCGADDASPASSTGGAGIEPRSAGASERLCRSKITIRHAGYSRDCGHQRVRATLRPVTQDSPFGESRNEIAASSLKLHERPRLPPGAFVI
ncbi:hypothetical protein BJF87_19820 [Gordonia sp. CNJ-863]|nr:hypothetical protein BJF87_19820 [Gordonia sp. CNJ-863]